MSKSKLWVLIIACKWVPNIEFDFDVCVDSRQCLTDTSKSYSMLGMLPKGTFLCILRALSKKLLTDFLKLKVWLFRTSCCPGLESRILSSCFPFYLSKNLLQIDAPFSKRTSKWGSRLQISKKGLARCTNIEVFFAISVFLSLFRLKLHRYASIIYQ